jgi:hypothetical protein
VVNNAGTLRKSAGAGTSSVNVRFNNSGTVEALAGTLGFASYNQTAGRTVLGDGTLSCVQIDIQGGSLTGSGTVNGSVRNAGLVAPGGTGAGQLTITGNYTQLATGVLRIELGGLTAGSQYDRLVVLGSTTLDGTLDILLLEGFLPSPGNMFLPLTFASRTGTFATINGLNLGSGLLLAPTYSATNLALTVI